ncbi:Mfa1 family fimbria major subunit [Phocaeicola barnesiae]|uniref:Mfa1 family fimbria major subunit n=1 Tax=Phocaeicola barnesiae TaxID=376804 RepID=UPI00241D3F8A|nr:Mfa1 family fimbria major subunit [Phocaeicola barnesiae]
MKRWSYLFMAMGIATAFSACSDEVDLSANNGGGTEESTSQVFMQFNLELPAVSRSTTQPGGGSDAGVEIGKDYENQVSEVLVVITDATAGDTYDDFIAGSTVTNLIPTGNNTTYVVPFNTNKLVDYVGDPVNIYVYCNPTKELKEKLEKEEDIDVDASYTLTSATDETIWSITKGTTDNKKIGHFLMTNADNDYKRTLPANLDNYKVESNPFDLGTINVERAAARFDYKSSVANETYTLMEDEERKPEVTVTLTDMALVNLSKEFYYLRRVSADGTNTSATIGGTEVGGTSANYVVDTDADWKSSYSSGSESDHFYYIYQPNDASASTYDWDRITDVTGTNGTDDNNNSWNTDNSKGDYKIWCYATENTIPAQVSNQKKGITTGVAFKGEIQGATADMKTLLNGTNTVYVFDNILWGTWDNVKTAAEVTESGNTTLANPLLAAAYKEAMKGGYADAKAVDAGFTIFKPNTDGKYEVLYYYWNRHNDNDNNGSMGPMEFAVVRNNVYKLSVTGVNKFGHPTNPGDDPDPENPEDPDEEDDVYFKVAVEVLPWVVRINDIEF